MKVCSTWVCLERILSGFWMYLCTFMKDYMTFERFLLLLLTFFDPFLTLSGAILWAILKPFWVDPVSLWGHLGIILASFRARFGVVSTPFWYTLRLFGGLFWTFLGHFRTVLANGYGHFASFGWCFGKLTATFSKMMQNMAKICKFLPKFTKMMQNYPKMNPFSPLKPTLVLNLSVFMQLHEGLEDFWTVFGHFWPPFWPFF